MAAAGERRVSLDPWTVATAVVAGIAGVAGSYFVAGGTSAFAATPLFDLVVRRTPAAVVTTSITALGDLGFLLAVATALGLAVAVLAAVTLVAIGVGARTTVPHAGAILAGAAGWGLTELVTGAPLSALGVGVPVTAVVAIAAAEPMPVGEFVPGRRRVLYLLAGAAGLGGVSYLAHLDDAVPAGAALQADRATMADIEAKLSASHEASLDIAGLTGLVSEIGEFYELDLNPINPTPDAETWSLRITGAVERERELSYDELLALPAENRFITLRCVGESLNGHKMDNALWTGVPVWPLVESAGPTGQFVMLRAADDYFEGFPIEPLRRGFLAYGMNGEVLPRAHGFPVRALVPGHWGEINVKWLTEIQVLGRAEEGYWEGFGWRGTGPVHTVAKLHAINRLGGGRVQVGGHAYAGLRGVSAVEVSTDGGATWEEAALSVPLPGDDVWRQWAYEFRPRGETTVVVRTVEADGTIQPEAHSPSFPSGPTGWVTRTVSP